MDDAEGKTLLDAVMQRFRQLSYDGLVAQIGDVHTEYPRGASGDEYTIEIEVIWDARPGGDIRVLGSIDNGRGWRAFCPLTDDFLVTVDGEFPGDCN